MTSVRSIAAAAALCVLFGAGLAGAQPALPSALGQPVVSQTITISGRPSSEAILLELLQTTVGAPLTATAVRETIAHFVGLGRYDDVVVSAAPVGGGVALTYDLVPARAVRHVVFRGDVGVSERLLRDGIEERFGEAFPLARIADLSPFLESLYKEQGYLQARVTPRPDVAQPGDPDALVVEVAAGPRVRISQVVVEGNAPVALQGIATRSGLAAGQF